MLSRMRTGGYRMGAAVCAVVLACSAWPCLGADNAADVAKEVLRVGGIKGGLAVCIGGDGQLVAELARGGRFVVHGLIADRATAAAAREKLAAAGLAGIAGVECFPPAELPYADDLVSLLVADDASAAPLGEVMRVLRPEGVACLAVKADDRKAVEGAVAKAGIKDARFEQASGLWLVLTKPRPKGMDDWTHWNHGPDGNLVSQDQLIDRPNQIQWIAGPQWGDHRGIFVWGAGSPSGVRSAGARNYYIIGSQLVARDAFNGVMLWTRKVVGLRSAMVVASGKEVYLVGDDKIMAIDGATGEDVRAYGPADRCRALILADGVLLAFQGGQVRAFDAASGQQKWSSREAAGASSPVVKAGKVYCLARGKLVCLNLADGKVAWTRPGKVEMLFAFGDKVLVRTAAEGDRAKTAYTYIALAGADGKEAWKYTADRTKERFNEAYFAAGLVWVQSAADRTLRDTKGFHNPKGGVSYLWQGLNPATGKVDRQFLQPVTLQYRCHREYMTDRFLIGNRPVYFTDWRDGKVTRFEATRISCGGVCGLAEGMFYGLYTNSAQCMCVRPAMSGVTAYRCDPVNMNGAPATEADDRFEKGPASAPKAPRASDADWPMYRHDMHRTAFAAETVPAELKIAWQKELTPPAPAVTPANDWRLDRVFSDAASQPVVAGGKAFVALTQSQQVVALDAAKGTEAWRFHAPARLGAPPTVYKGLCLVGCHDGWVYCLRADDGKRAWRFRAAPARRRIVAYGQVESAWPVVGGVLIADDKAYVVAGRTTETDGGVYVHCLDPLTGGVIWSAQRVKPDDGAIGAWNLRGLRNDYFGPADVLCSDGATVAISAHRAGRFKCATGENVSRGGIAGPKFGLMRSRYAADNQHVDYPPVAFAPGSYVHFQNVRNKATRKRTPYIVMSGRGPWRTELPGNLAVESLAVAGDKVLAAMSYKGRTAPGVLWILSRADGKKLGTCPLPAGPAFEGLSVAGGKVYVALQNGAVACLAGK